MSKTCAICGRKLDQNDNPLSLDCGGDCWGCIGDIEAGMGRESSLAKVRQEFAEGLRPEWVDTSADALSEFRK
jgi:hypothetical protein